MRYKYLKLIICFLILIITLEFGNNYYIKGDINSNVNAKKSTGSIQYLDKILNIKNPLYFVTGKLYLPLEDVVSSMGGYVSITQDAYIVKFSNNNFEIFKEDDEKLTHKLFFVDKNPYISLYDFSNLFHLAVVFDCKNEIVKLYKRDKPKVPDMSKVENKQAAYLRLEDVSAQVVDNGESMEKLRVIIDYLYSMGQHFYIAWIPLYEDISQNIEIDLTRDFNFYNANFIYTLDYAVNHFGHIVLHGLTHQEEDASKGIRPEFGYNSPFTDKEIEERMKRAKEIASTLGYDNSIFEFPHYFSSPNQLRIAEKNFKVIYQQSYYDSKVMGKIDERRRNNHTVLYVPTPVGYLESYDKLPEFLGKIEQLPNDQLMSMFIHPYLEFDKIECITNKEGKREFYYSNNGIFKQVVQKIIEKGFTFSQIPIK